MRIFKLKDLKDRYVTVHTSVSEKPKLYLVIPIDDEYGVGILIADNNSNSR